MIYTLIWRFTGWEVFLHVSPYLHGGFSYLQDINGAAFISVANLDLAYKMWVLCHQLVYEFIDLRWERRKGETERLNGFWESRRLPQQPRHAVLSQLTTVATQTH